MGVGCCWIRTQVGRTSFQPSREGDPDMRVDERALKHGPRTRLTSTRLGLLGTVTDYIQQERPARSAPGQDSPDYWRAYHTLPVETFFREWRDNYRRLEWAMVPGNPDDGVMFRHNDRATDVSRFLILRSFAYRMFVSRFLLVHFSYPTW